MIANDPRSTPAVPAPDWVQAAGKKGDSTGSVRIWQVGN